MKSINPVAVPIGSEISNHLKDSYFFDAYEMELENENLTALEVYLNLVSKTPLWVERLMSIRNSVVSIFGLKNLGNLSSINSSKRAGEYEIGDRVGIFTIYSISENEVVFSDSDKHLNAKVSLCTNYSLENNSVVVSTVVHVNNLLGRFYMFFVTPVHKIIVPAMLKKLV